jgi:hypothetical protein
MEEMFLIVDRFSNGRSLGDMRLEDMEAIAMLLVELLNDLTQLADRLLMGVHILMVRRIAHSVHDDASEAGNISNADPLGELFMQLTHP